MARKIFRRAVKGSVSEGSHRNIRILFKDSYHGVKLFFGIYKVIVCHKANRGGSHIKQQIPVAGRSGRVRESDNYIVSLQVFG